MKARVKKVSVMYRDLDTAVLMVDVDKSVLAQMPGTDKPLTVEITVERKKRSLSQSAYMWVLLDKIARLVGGGITKDALYRKYIREAGVFDASIWISREAYDTFKRRFEAGGMGNQVDIARSKDGMLNVICYYGSHGYSTKEMSFLLDHIIADAQDMGIPTMTPAERAKLS